jgi:hypothetical protein
MTNCKKRKDLFNPNRYLFPRHCYAYIYSNCNGELDAKHCKRKRYKTLILRLLGFYSF